MTTHEDTGAWQEDIGNGIPVLGGVEWIQGGTEQDYINQCAETMDEGASGAYVFNFPASGYVSPFTASPWSALSLMCVN